MQPLDLVEGSDSLDTHVILRDSALHVQSSRESTESALAQPLNHSKCSLLNHSVQDRPLVATVPAPGAKSQGPFQSKSLTFCAPAQGMLVAGGSSSSTSSRPIIRSRAVLPIPVPNLIKKSRGRHVPTEAAEVETDSASTSQRHYTCPVEACGKRFGRGEHLKRHIRSIHTNEKPFKCTHGSCKKTFNRHDNLLQHLRVHQPEPSPVPLSDPKAPYTAPFQVIQEHPQGSNPPHLGESLTSPPTHSPRLQPPVQTLVGSYSLIQVPPPNSSVHCATNQLAVSSLRTDLASSLPSHEYNFPHVTPGANDIQPAELHIPGPYIIRPPFTHNWP